jgi:transposase
LALVVLSVVEQRLDAVRAVLAGMEVTEVAVRAGVHRATVHRWVGRYLAEQIGGLADRSHRPASCPHQAAEAVEVAVAEMRREHPRWGSRRIRLELLRRPLPWKDETLAVPSERTIDRILIRYGLLRQRPRKRPKEWFKRFQRPGPMQLWGIDIVAGVQLVDTVTGELREAKLVTGIDDHSRFCVMATVVERATARAVCLAFAQALARYGVPEEVITDNGKQFTDRFNRYGASRGEVLFDKICRNNGITHRLTQPASPNQNGKVCETARDAAARLPRRRRAVRVRGDGPGRGGRVGGLLQHRPAASGPGRQGPCRPGRAGRGSKAVAAGNVGGPRHPPAPPRRSRNWSPGWPLCLRLWCRRRLVSVFGAVAVRSSWIGWCRRRGTCRCAGTVLAGTRAGRPAGAVLDRLRVGAPVDRWAPGQDTAVPVRRQRPRHAGRPGCGPGRATAAGVQARTGQPREPDHRGGRADRRPGRDGVAGQAGSAGRVDAGGAPGRHLHRRRCPPCCSSTPRPESCYGPGPTRFNPARPRNCSVPARSGRCHARRPSRSGFTGGRRTPA